MDNWFPGHMARAKRSLRENLGLVDIVVQVLDARLPRSSFDWDMSRFVLNKPRILVMNKCDIADDELNKAWARYYESIDLEVVLVDAISGKGIKALRGAICRLYDKKCIRRVDFAVKSVRVGIVGIPNVGKSSIINKLIGSAVTKTANKPGVTKLPGWLRLKEEGWVISLLDTPGILPVNLSDLEVARSISFVGGLPDSADTVEEVCCSLLSFLRDNYCELLKNRFDIRAADIDERIEDLESYEILELLGKRRGCVVPGGGVDFARISTLVLKDFRAGKIGRITLQMPNS